MAAPCERPLVAVVAGLTASGKTALALDLAASFHGEVINADSMQIYRGFDIGTAKPSVTERASVPHHLIDILDATDVYSVARFVDDARRTIHDVWERGRLPIVCGGTGQYTTALLDGLRFYPMTHDDEQVRAIDEMIEHEGLEAAYARLARLDPDAAQRIDPHDRTRIHRFFLVYTQSGMTRTAMNAWSKTKPTFDALTICLAPAVDTLYPRIDMRTTTMFDRGLVAESKALDARYRDETLTPFRAIGYRAALAVLKGEMSENEAITLTMRDTRRYAKRQRTWYRHHDHGPLIDPDDNKDAYQTYRTRLMSELAKRGR